VLAEQVARLVPGRTQANTGQTALTGKRILIEEAQRVHLEGMAQQQRLVGTANIFGTLVVGRLQGLEFRTGFKATEIVNGVCQRPEQEGPDLPLLIIKWPDKCGALVGDIVTFSLKYTNRSARPITDVVVSDSLTGRFEYVANSSRTDRPGIFTTQPNGAGSMLLRWEFSGELPPGESGLITFQVRVR
jgi:uncharacterized repeat protein (TIGR01451 family)